MARKSSLLKRTLASSCIILALYAIVNTFISSTATLKLDRSFPFSSANSVVVSDEFGSQDTDLLNTSGKFVSPVKIYLYDVPTRFTYGVIEHHGIARGGKSVAEVTALKYPGHQHMAEWFLFTDLLRPESERIGSAVVRVFDPKEADLFYAPFFASLSLIVNPIRPATSSGQQQQLVYSDEESQDAFMEWLEKQEYWKRNNGWDHVIIAQDPNALYRVIDRVKNSILLVSDFGRLRADQASLVKDVIVPYSHRINTYNGDIGVENRKTLLFFMGNRYRKEVLVRNVPPDPDESVSELVEHFFLVNHPGHYLTHQVVRDANKLAKLVKKKKKAQNWLDYYQLKYSRNSTIKPVVKTGFLGLWGKKVDAIEFQTAEIERLSIEIASERKRISDDPKSIMPAAFVSFKSRWGAAVCAQTQQSRNPTIWLSEWAPEPRDVYWENLAIPYVSLTIRRLIMGVAFFFLTFFFMIPISLVQSLASIEGIEKIAPFLKPLIERDFVKSFVQGFLPGIVLKLFLIFLPTILMIMAKFEGFTSLSSLERRAAARYYVFNFVNVFLGSVIAGAAFEQLNTFIKQSANEIPKTIGVAIPMKATFFITYIMVDGWAGIAGEILMLKPLIMFHLKNFFLVKTEKDREEAMDPGSLGFNTGEPRIQLYFLLGLVYATVTPLLLPFIIVFFALGFVVFRHQIINVYNQEYESAAAFWPDVHGRIIYALIFSQVVLMGLLSTKKAAQSTPFLIALPVITISFHLYCKGRYEPAFIRYPIEEAMMKDTLERAREPNLNLKGYLQTAYAHPVFKESEEDDEAESNEAFETESTLVATKRQSRRNTPIPSKASVPSSPSLPEVRRDRHQP